MLANVKSGSGFFWSLENPWKDHVNMVLLALSSMKISNSEAWADQIAAQRGYIGEW
jgi:hypothetical protein